jgi:hypothetical protein
MVLLINEGVTRQIIIGEVTIKETYCNVKGFYYDYYSSKHNKRFGSGELILSEKRD